MSGILCSAWLVKRFGTRNVILVTMSCALIGMMILSLALWLTSPLLFAVGLGVFGASFGSAEVAINVEGAAVEREMNKTVLPMMHGFYSLGTLAGAGVGMALTAFGVPATVHILLAALVGIAPIYIAIQAIPDGTGKNAADGTQHGEKGVPFYRDIQLLLIGVVVLAMAFAEGSANDWLPLLMVDGHGFSPTSGSLIYAGFTLGMTVGRFTGGWFIDRYSRVAVVRASALMGALGIGLIILSIAPGSQECLLYLGTRCLAGLPSDHFCRQRYRPRCTDPRQRGSNDRLSGFPRRAAAAGLSRRTLWIT
ncbi:DEOR-type transcriptional regulator [Escherichia coli]|uniref:DEOR-type transcriptional regulator n=1 Tax=Escherichia coli TaxID=562 RepID=A0A447XCI4_ECOLX|nr:DEOR-type transcriptional regulator [Escherichia coli]